MAEAEIFEELLSTYPAEKRDLARKVYQRFAGGDSAEFFSQLFLLLDVYAHYAEHIPNRLINANADALATAQEMREEIAMIAKAIEARDVNITNHATKTDELCKITQAKCNETIASVELMVKNLGSQLDTKAIVLGIQEALDKDLKAEVITPFLQHSKELGEQVVPTLKQIQEASSEAHTLWNRHIWKTAWTGVSSVMFVLFCFVTLGIYQFFDHYAERKAAAQIAEVSRVMNYNQEAFRQLAIAQVPVHVTRTQSYGVANPQNFALIVEGADSTEIRHEGGNSNGYVFFTSRLSEEQIQILQKELDKLTQNSNGKSK